jgi:hypothetical protein
MAGRLRFRSSQGITETDPSVSGTLSDCSQRPTLAKSGSRLCRSQAWLNKCLPPIRQLLLGSKEITDST